MGDRCKIITDGTASGTRIYNADGNEIPGVRSMVWEIGKDESDARVSLVFDRGAVELRNGGNDR